MEKQRIIFSTRLVYLIMIFLFLILGILNIIFNTIWSSPSVNESIRFLYLPTLIVLIFLHELLHATTAYYFSKKRSYRKIRIGFNLKKMIAFCSCEELFNVRKTCIITLVPLFILGIIPLIISFTGGFPIFYKLSMVMIAISAGDILIFYHLCKESNKQLLVNIRILRKYVIIEFYP